MVESTPTSIEQVPLFLLFMLHWTAPPSVFGRLDEPVSDAELGAGMVSLIFLMETVATHMDRLNALADEHKLYTAPAPLTISAGEWTICKHADGWYELTRRATILAPPWGR